MDNHTIGKRSGLRALPSGGGGGDLSRHGEGGGKRGIGRPQKYAMVLWSLRDDVLYSAATVANRAIQLGMTGAARMKDADLERQRIRIAMGRFVNNHAFPDNGDGNVRLKGQAPTPGWPRSTSATCWWSIR